MAVLLPFSSVLVCLPRVLQRECSAGVPHPPRAVQAASGRGRAERHRNGLQGLRQGRSVKARAGEGTLHQLRSPCLRRDDPQSHCTALDSRPWLLCEVTFVLVLGFLPSWAVRHSGPPGSEEPRNMLSPPEPLVPTFRSLRDGSRAECCLKTAVSGQPQSCGIPGCCVCGVNTPVR